MSANSNLYDNIQIDITNDKGVPVALSIDAGDVFNSVKVNWATFCEKITIKQKRYGEASIATLTFSLVSSYGRMGGEKNSVIKNPIQLGDRVTITIKKNIDLSNYFDISEGGIVHVGGDKKIFVGYVWNISQNHLGEVNITCYDLLKYLQNQKCFFSYTKGQTAMQIINSAVSELNLGKGEKGIKLKLDTALFTAYKVDTTGTQEKFYEYGKNFIDMVNWLLNRCLMSGLVNDTAFGNYMLFLVDYETNSINIGTASMLGRISPYVICGKSMISECELNQSIESDVYNSIYAGIDYVSTDIGGMWWGLTTETGSVEQLGTLPHYERFSQSDFYKEDTTLTIDAVKKIMEKMVLIKNKPKVKLTLKGIGNPFLHAGMLVPVSLPKSMVDGLLTSYSMESAVSKDTPIVLIDEINHTITQNTFEMDFTASVLLDKFVSWKSANTKEIK